jgi:hypothetical protein
MPTLQITVDDEQVLAAMRRAEGLAERIIVLAAKDLGHEAQVEGGRVARHLAEPWEEQLHGLQASVAAPEFWAHFLAHGTSAHGPVSAERLVFTVEGETVFATSVSGIAANPFDERAMADTERNLSRILQQALAEVE